MIENIPEGGHTGIPLGLAESAMVETRRATELTQRIVMLDDLCHLIAQSDGDPQMADLDRELRSSLLDQLRGWAEARNELLASGLRSTWVDRAVMDARAKSKPMRVKPERPPPVLSRGLAVMSRSLARLSERFG